MVRPDRDLLTGRVEADECYVGGLEEGLPGRLNLKKALVVVAAQEDGPGIGRIRMRQIVDASAESLVPFVRDSVEPGSAIHTDGRLGYLPLERRMLPDGPCSHTPKRDDLLITKTLGHTSDRNVIRMQVRRFGAVLHCEHITFEKEQIA
jgi:hypothetical protein